MPTLPHAFFHRAWRMPLTLLALMAACDGGGGGGDGGDGGGEDLPIDDDQDGYIASADCNDADPEIHPGATEVCDGVDQDCNGQVDDGLEFRNWFTDADGDSWGADDSHVSACAAPDGTVERDGDCNDNDANVNPDVDERCNGGVDDDCDGLADALDDGVVDADSWYVDGDGDGYGAGSEISGCERPAEASDNGLDCDDDAAAVHPGADEACNGLDDDCDPATTEDGVVTGEDGSYADIQSAIDAAAPGDTVRVCAGVYNETLEVDRDITLDGVDGADLTTLDARRDGAAISVTSTGVDLTVRGFTITRGSGSVPSTADFDYLVGGGIQAYDADFLELSDCVITKNEAEVGGGVIGPHFGDVTILDSSFDNNVANNGAAGGLLIYHSKDSTADISGCEIVDNYADYHTGGAAVLHAGTGTGTVTISDTTISGNEGIEYAGGIGSDSADLTLSGVTITANVAPYGGGMFLMNATVEADDSTSVTSNVADTSGGGLYMVGGTWTGGTFEDNDALFGGGIMIDTSGEVAETTLSTNTAVYYGGGVYMTDDGQLDGVEVTDNQADLAGGGVATAQGADMVLVDSSIVSNTAGEGGGAYCYMGTIVSTRTSWGSGSTDNDPDDIELENGTRTYSYSDYGSSETFDCDAVTGSCL